MSLSGCSSHRSCSEKALQKLSNGACTYTNVIIDIAKLAAEMIELLTYFRKLGLAVAISRLHHT